MSFKHNFFISIVRGVGYAIGASLVAVLVVGVMMWLLRSAERIPFLQDALNAEEIEQRLDR